MLLRIAGVGTAGEVRVDRHHEKQVEQIRGRVRTRVMSALYVGITQPIKAECHSSSTASSLRGDGRRRPSRKRADSMDAPFTEETV
jgi:hypothetical protein